MEDTLKILIDSIFWIDLNANDFFYWGCADVVRTSDPEVLAEVIDKFGQAGVDAFLVHLRDAPPQPPVLKRIETNYGDKYKEALEWLQENHSSLCGADESG